MLPNMEALIDRYCNRTWAVTNPITEKFDGGTDTFFVASPAIASITSVTIGGSPVSSSDIYNYGSYIKLASPAPYGPQSVVIVYTSAATTVPAPVKLALIEWMARKIHTSPDAGKEAAQVQTGSVSVRYTEDKVGGVPDFVRLVLDQYRIIPV